MQAGISASALLQRKLATDLSKAVRIAVRKVLVVEPSVELELRCMERLPEMQCLPAPIGVRLILFHAALFHAGDRKGVRRVILEAPATFNDPEDHVDIGAIGDGERLGQFCAEL